MSFSVSKCAPHGFSIDVYGDYLRTCSRRAHSDQTRSAPDVEK
jgi:hypothetical protein